MTIELLDADFISKRIKEQGRTRKWLIEQLGLGQDGYKLLRGEWMPKDQVRKTQVLKGLSKVLGVGVSDILLRLEVPQKEPA